MTAAVSDEIDDEGRGVPGMKQSHEFRTRERVTRTIGCEREWLRPNFIAVCLDETEDRAQQPRNLGMSPQIGPQLVSPVSPGLQA
jgi:hypothetical protein